MDYKVLYRKYRPQTFDDVVGQEWTTKLLKNSILEERISHAYIFTGPRGTGKTSNAKIFAKAINCLNPKDGNPCNECDMCKQFKENPDIIEIDAASNNGVDDIRELIDNSRLAPSVSKYKVYIIDEFHMLSASAFNALLLTLEEPPSNVVFILATTDIQCVPITVLSRCQRFDFRPITFDNIVNRLRYVCDEEKIEIDDDAIEEIAYMSNGGLRDALSILDQISAKDGRITVDDIVSNFGSVSTEKLKNIIEYLENENVDGIISSIADFKSSGVDYLILVSKLINLLKKILLDIRLGNSDYGFQFEYIYDLIFELNSSVAGLKSSIDPYIFIEIVLLKYVKTGEEYNGSNVIKSEVKSESVSNNNVSVVKTKEIKKDDGSFKKEVKDNIELNGVEKKKIELNDISYSFSVDIRVNNCFAGVSRDCLNKIKEKWDDFIIYESNANKKLLSYILDTSIVCASDKYCILTNKSDAAVSLINDNIQSLEKDFNIFYGINY